MMNRQEWFEYRIGIKRNRITNDAKYIPETKVMGGSWIEFTDYERDALGYYVDGVWSLEWAKYSILNHRKKLGWYTEGYLDENGEPLYENS